MAVGSFSAGLSGLNANAQALSVIGNNPANLNTVGFKASTVTFEDLVYQSVGGSTENPTQIGLGHTTIDPITKAVIAAGEPVEINVPPGLLRAPLATTQFAMSTNLNAQ